MSEAAALIKELIEIGAIPKIIGEAESERFYWRPPGEGVGPSAQWDPRTRQIGEELRALGGGSIRLMRAAHQQVVDALGPLAGHALSAHWNAIGETEWSAGRGEVWDH